MLRPDALETRSQGGSLQTSGSQRKNGSTTFLQSPINMFGFLKKKDFMYKKLPSLQRRFFEVLRELKKVELFSSREPKYSKISEKSLEEELASG